MPSIAPKTGRKAWHHFQEIQKNPLSTPWLSQNDLCYKRGVVGQVFPWFQCLRNRFKSTHVLHINPIETQKWKACWKGACYLPLLLIENLFQTALAHQEPLPTQTPVVEVARHKQRRTGGDVTINVLAKNS